MKRHVLTSEKVNRLFKLLDFHNRSNVQLIDFERALRDHKDTKKAPKKVARHQRSRGNFYWIRIAKDKIGEYISKNYKSVSVAFHGKHRNSG